MESKPLLTHLRGVGTPEGMSLSDASRKGAALKALRQSEGWAVLEELIETRLAHEQKVLMQGQKLDDNGYERTIGQWAGMRRIDMLVEGMIRVGDRASELLEKGETSAEVEVA